MWKWILGLVGVLLGVTVGLGAYLSDKIYLRFDHVATEPAQFGRLYSPDELQQDFAHAIATIEHIHPDIEAAIDVESFEARRADIVQALNRPMTRLDFYNIASRINGAYRDGHTSIRLPSEEWSAARGAYLAPPIKIRLEGDGIVIEQILGAASPVTDARLVSINGRSAADVAEWLLSRESGENLPARRAYAGARFPERAWAMGLRSPYEIVYTTGVEGAEARVSLQGVVDDDWYGATGPASAEMNLTIDDAIAVLRIDSFETPTASYSAFLRDSFDHIRDEGVTSLILDMRHNSGGDTRQSDELQSYLSEHRLPALAQVSVHATPEVKAIYRTLLPEGFRWLPVARLVPMLGGIEDTPDNGGFAFAPEAAQPQRRWLQNGRRFSGDLYILIGPYTYSTAAIFVAPFKHWERATLIGQETGEPMTFFGDNYEFDLPRTHLVASASHKTFELLGSSGTQHGVAPDLVADVGGPDAIEVARAEIARRAGVVSHEGLSP